MPRSCISLSWITALAALLSGCATQDAVTSPSASNRAHEQISQRLKEICDAAAKKDFVRLDSYHAYRAGVHEVRA